MKVYLALIAAALVLFAIEGQWIPFALITLSAVVRLFPGRAEK